MADSISSLSTSNALRAAVQRMQNELTTVRAEASSGKIADRGLALGVRSSVSVDLHEQVQRIDTIKTLNSAVAGRIEATDSALTSIGKIVSNVMQQLMQVKTAGGDVNTAISVARDALSSFNDRVNSSFSGQYLFSGVNTDVKPVADDPNDPASPGRAAVDAAFLAKFGVTQSSSAVSSISASDMTSFLDTQFAALFDDTGWRSQFSAASQKPIQSRVSMTEIVDSSVSADGQAFRQITSALTMIAQTGIDKMSAATRGAVVDRAVAMLGAGQEKLTSAQAALGASKLRVDDATNRLTIQSQSLAKTIGSFEDVDPYQVSVQLNNLSTQLETAYSLTSRIQQLSLLKYL